LALMALTIRAAIEEGAVEFDMLYGHEPYKYLWARTERSLMRLRLFPPNVAGQLLHHQAEARSLLRSVAHQIGLRRHDHA
jgi:CelD/BcsL family acetyltransferase involved in cellulose biosynthesis